MSNDRTLPVTPAERACATVLRAYLAWNVDANPEPITVATGFMLRLGDFLAKERVVVEDIGDATPAGAALLARVEAAERTPAAVLRAMVHAYQDAAVEAEAEVFRAMGKATNAVMLRMFDTQKEAANMRAVAATYAAEGLLLPWLDLHTDYAARLAGTTPIDAPPAKEPR